jgi:hypothetical protein
MAQKNVLDKLKLFCVVSFRGLDVAPQNNKQYQFIPRRCVMLINQSLSSFKKSLVVAGAVLCLSAGAAQAASQTGAVQWYFTQDYAGGPVYTFVNVAPGFVCYYVGENTALASIFATTQNAGGTVTVSCDTNYKITQVAN